jgi:hypothetical protein
MVILGDGILLNLDQTIRSAAVKKQSIPAAKAKPGWAAGLPRALPELIAGWFSQWGLPGFERHITVDFSTRLQRTLGRCHTKRRRIHVAASPMS